MRFVLEVFEAVRREWPRDRPLGARISATDWIDGGWNVEESVALCRELMALGCDYVTVSFGGLSMAQQIAIGEGHLVPLATGSSARPTCRPARVDCLDPECSWRGQEFNEIDHSHKFISLD